MHKNNDALPLRRAFETSLGTFFSWDWRKKDEHKQDKIKMRSTIFIKFTPCQIQWIAPCSHDMISKYALISWEKKSKEIVTNIGWKRKQRRSENSCSQTNASTLTEFLEPSPWNQRSWPETDDNSWYGGDESGKKSPECRFHGNNDAYGRRVLIVRSCATACVLLSVRARACASRQQKHTLS